MSEQPLRIGLLTYRGNPRSGGQGVYVRHLSRELAALGHKVDVWSGQPYPELADTVGLKRVPGMDLWKEKVDGRFRLPSPRELRDPINLSEYTRTITGGFAEPRTFSRRVARHFRQNGAREAYDIIHDNQCLGPGMLDLRRYLPVVATVHHPVTMDRRIAIGSTRSIVKRYGLRRWYAFLPSQIRVARRLDRILTVSEASATDIARDYGIERQRINVVGNGIDLDVFRPQPEVARDENRIMTTMSADSPLKGLRFLLEALATLRKTRPRLTLTVIGEPTAGTKTRQLVGDLGLEAAVRFTGRVEAEEIVGTYARSALAVVPSLYEGFGFPAGEAMACEVAVVSTTAGALPEVVGGDGRCGLLVEPRSAPALARAIGLLLDDPHRRLEMGENGRKRVESMFSWRAAAERTAGAYREVIARKEEARC